MAGGPDCAPRRTKRVAAGPKRQGALALVLGALIAPADLCAQTAAPAPASPAAEEELPDVYVDADGTIVVTERTPRGAVIDNVTPEQILDADDVRATGANDVGELIALLRPQLGVPPGSEPIVLINGRRVGSQRAISVFPREAIERLEILPAHVALSYGYPAESRVMNIVLRESYRGGNGEAVVGFATEGGRDSQEAKFTFVAIAGDNSVTFNAQVGRDDRLLESQRGIIQPASPSPYDLVGNITGALPQQEIDPALSATVGRPVSIAGVPLAAVNGPAGLADFAAFADAQNLTDIGRFRTLLPASRRLELSSQLNRLLGSAALNLTARFARTTTESRLGLASARLFIPAGNPFSPFGNDFLLYRYFSPGDPLERDQSTEIVGLTARLSGGFSNWTWDYIAVVDHSRNVARTDTGLDLAAAQDRIDSLDPMLNPFGILSGAREVEVSRLSATRLGNSVNLNGRPFRLPAGPARLTLSANYNIRLTERESSSLPAALETSRQTLDGRIFLNLPITSRRNRVGSAFGNFELVLNAAVQREPRSTLLALGYGGRWQPRDTVFIDALLTRSEQALNDEQLNAPVVETPNVRIFDFRTGETVEVTQIAGGNPALLAPRASNLRLSLNAPLLRRPSVFVGAAYVRRRLGNLPGDLTSPIPEIEAAFPNRFLRDAEGRLLRFDSRPINFARSERSEISGEFRISLPLGAQSAPVPRAPGQVGPPPSDAESGPAALGSRLLGQIGFTYGLSDELLIREGIPPIDLFESGYGGGAGRSRLSINYLLIASYRGWRARLQGAWTGGRTARSPQSQLDYSSLSILNAQVSFDLGARPQRVGRNPFFNGLSVSLEVRNLLNDRVRVRDEDGETPLSLQPAYLDPLGRSVRLSLRKAF